MVTFSPYIALLTLRDGKHKIQDLKVEKGVTVEN